METAVAEDSEVLGSGDGETVLVEGAEFDGVAVERGFEDRHDGLGVLLSFDYLKECICFSSELEL